MPGAVGGRRFPAQDVEIAVIRTNFVKSILRAVPLVHYLFDHVLTILKSKTNRPFVRRPPGIAIDLQLHSFFSFSSFWRASRSTTLLAPRSRSETAEPKHLTTLNL